jgi:EAL domain-containing protein (putative c-di-GMP-specific phosphodiesterase class I)
MSESLEIETVAEGIEDADQASRMRDLGCTYGQGYYFARPMAPESIAPDVPAVHAVRRSRRPTTAVARYLTPVRESSVA